MFFQLLWRKHFCFQVWWDERQPLLGEPGHGGLQGGQLSNDKVMPSKSILHNDLWFTNSHPRLLAWGPREAVFKQTEDASCSGADANGYVSKGTKWYYHPSDLPGPHEYFSRGVWGFAAGNQSLNLHCVDIATEGSDNRLSYWIDFESRPELGGYR